VIRALRFVVQFPVSLLGVIGIVCAISCGPPSAAQSKVVENGNRLWTQDLVPDLGRTIAGASSLAGVAFLDDERLIVYAVTRDPHQLSSRESPEISSPFRLQAWVVDAGSGRTEAHKEWGTRVFDSAVHVTTGGILVKTGGVMKLYSADFAQARDLPLALDPNGSYFVSVSSTGHTIAISHYFRKGHNYISHLDVLDANTLQIRRSWDQYPPLFHLSMSDNVYYTRGDSVTMTEFGSTHPSKMFAVPESSKRGCAAGGSRLVVSDELIVLRDCSEVLILTADAASYSLDTFNGQGLREPPGVPCEPYNSGISKASVASGETRFVALTLPNLKIRKPLLAEWRTCLDGLQIAQYDLTLKKRVSTVSVSPLPKNDYDLALSPDGSKLAVLNDRTVSVYSVPVQSNEEGRVSGVGSAVNIGAGPTLPPPRLRLLHPCVFVFSFAGWA
jgi:hypothetical protein